MKYVRVGGKLVRVNPHEFRPYKVRISYTTTVDAKLKLQAMEDAVYELQELLRTHHTFSQLRAAGLRIR